MYKQTHKKRVPYEHFIAQRKDFLQKNKLNKKEKFAL